MIECSVIVPLYKEKLSLQEELTLKHSIFELKIKNLIFLGPTNFDYGYYLDIFKGVEIQKFDDKYFKSVEGYNSLLLNPDFYKNFHNSNFILIYQTDALILKDEIEYWCNQPFDYIGAPWPKKFEYQMEFDNFQKKPTKIISDVGNGGFSLRRVSKCLTLLEEFPELLSFFINSKSSEDLFFGIGSKISNNFMAPNEIIASLFSLELDADRYFSINRGKKPMGGHAWEKYQPEFWYKITPFLSL
jgi:hypothetical protein